MTYHNVPPTEFVRLDAPNQISRIILSGVAEPPNGFTPAEYLDFILNENLESLLADAPRRPQVEKHIVLASKHFRLHFSELAANQRNELYRAVANILQIDVRTIECTQFAIDLTHSQKKLESLMKTHFNSNIQRNESMQLLNMVEDEVDVIERVSTPDYLDYHIGRNDERYLLHDIDALRKAVRKLKLLQEGPRIIAFAKLLLKTSRQRFHPANKEPYVTLRTSLTNEVESVFNVDLEGRVESVQIGHSKSLIRAAGLEKMKQAPAAPTANQNLEAPLKERVRAFRQLMRDNASPLQRSSNPTRMIGLRAPNKAEVSRIEEQFQRRAKLKESLITAVETESLAGILHPCLELIQDHNSGRVEAKHESEEWEKIFEALSLIGENEVLPQSEAEDLALSIIEEITDEVIQSIAEAERALFALSKTPETQIARTRIYQFLEWIIRKLGL